jgi:biotin synthase
MENLLKEILDGKFVNRNEIQELAENASLELLTRYANKIRQKYCGDKIELCSIINAKSGRCSENCKYCAQSVHYKTNADVYPLISIEKILSEAKQHQDNGVHRLSLVTSGKKLDNADFQNIILHFDKLVNSTQMKICASLGILDNAQLSELQKHGIIRYHHNLETSRRFFPSVCTTHTYDDRIKTIKLAQQAGLEICSGGIFGLGETLNDRIDMAFDLRELNVKSVPINILMPVKGTPLENQKALSTDEILRSIALYRIILPYAFIRYAGGRASLNERVKEGLQGGINAMLTGDFLTTTGSNTQSDIKMLIEMGFKVN